MRRRVSGNRGKDKRRAAEMENEEEVRLRGKEEERIV